MKCFKEKHPKDYAALSSKNAALRERCVGCATATPQSTDPATGKRYCRACFAKHCPQAAAAVNLRRSKAPTSVGTSAAAADDLCYYCCSNAADVAPRQCTYAGEACTQQIVVCDRCSSVHSVVVCAACYGRCWRQRCFGCKASAGEMAKTGGGRYCEDCAAGGVHDGRCYFCWAAGEDVQRRTCTHGSPTCQQEVLLCNVCDNLHGVSVCARCYHRDWKGKCFHCRSAKAREEAPYARFCQACHALPLDDEGDPSQRLCYYCRCCSTDVDRPSIKIFGTKGGRNPFFRCALHNVRNGQGHLGHFDPFNVSLTSRIVFAPCGVYIRVAILQYIFHVQKDVYPL